MFGWLKGWGRSLDGWDLGGWMVGFVGWFNGKMVGWLDGWIVGGGHLMVGWLVGWLVGC